MWHTGYKSDGLIVYIGLISLSSRIDAINKFLHSLESEVVHYIDHNSTFRDLHRILDRDDIHLRSVGVRQMADNFKLALMGRHPAQVTQHSRPPRNTTTRPIGNQRNSYRTQQPGQLRNNNTPSIRSPQPLVNAGGAPKSRSALMPSYSPPGDAPTSRSALQPPYFPPSGTSTTGYTSPPVQLPLRGVPTPSYASQPPYLPFGGAPTSGYVSPPVQLTPDGAHISSSVSHPQYPPPGGAPTSGYASPPVQLPPGGAPTLGSASPSLQLPTGGNHTSGIGVLLQHEGSVYTTPSPFCLPTNYVSQSDNLPTVPWSSYPSGDPMVNPQWMPWSHWSAGASPWGMV